MATRKTDGPGHSYFDVENIRITCIPQTWDNNKPGLRIQAYTGSGDALFQGAEIPIPDKATAYEFIKAIAQALELNGI